MRRELQQINDLKHKIADLGQQVTNEREKNAPGGRWRVAERASVLEEVARYLTRAPYDRLPEQIRALGKMPSTLLVVERAALEHFRAAMQSGSSFLMIGAMQTICAYLKEPDGKEG